MAETGLKVIKTPGGGLWVNQQKIDQAIDHEWFKPRFWAKNHQVTGQAAGRGAVHFVRYKQQQWALRHYRRGGLVGRFNQDKYLFTGIERVRSLSECRLLQALAQWQLPSPVPVAASWQRIGIWYRADLITERIDYEQTLAQWLAGAQPSSLETVLGRCGQTIARFHRHGVDHADLNCHNILLAGDRVYLIDFDRGRIRRSSAVPERWQQRNLNRLARSARKVVNPAWRAAMTDHWSALEAGYRDGLAGPSAG